MLTTCMVVLRVGLPNDQHLERLALEFCLSPAILAGYARGVLRRVGGGGQVGCRTRVAGVRRIGEYAERLLERGDLVDHPDRLRFLGAVDVSLPLHPQLLVSAALPAALHDVRGELVVGLMD